MKSKPLFLFFIFLIANVSAYNLQASPEEISFIGLSGDVICKTIQITIDTVAKIVVEDRWAIQGISERKFTAHKLTAQDIGIDITYKKEFAIINNKEVEICISGDKGSYHGLILFRVKGENAGIGVWTNVNIAPKGFSSIITGNVIGSSGEGPMILLISLMVILTILLVRKLIRVKSK